MFKWIKETFFPTRKVKVAVKPQSAKALKSAKVRYTKAELNKMTRKELEAYGRVFGFEVDKRLTKDKIVKQVASLKPRRK